MKIRNSFRIPLPPDQAWAVLNDIPRIAGCAPGAELLEQRPDGAYVGTVAVRLGPVALSFKGTFAYKDRDDAARRVVAEASGSEQKARGTARAAVIFTLTEEGTGSRVDVDTDVQLAGSIAQYGRGAALIQTTAQVIIDQFAANLAREFGGNAAPTPTPAAAAAPADTTPAGAAVAPPPPPPLPRPAQHAKPISATSVMWKVFLAWLRGLFGGSRA